MKKLAMSLVWFGFSCVCFSVPHASALETSDFFIPQARTLEEAELKFDLQTRFSLDKHSSTFIHESLWGLSYGVFQWNKFYLEAGFNWKEPTTRSTAAALAAHLRLVMNRVEEEGWAIGVGINELGFHPGENDLNYNHIVFQNTIGELWQMAFGGYSANSQYLGTDDKGMFAGVWRSIQRGHGRMGVEWQSGSHFLSYFVPGIKVEIRDGVMGYLAYGVANNRSLKDWVSMRISVLF